MKVLGIAPSSIDFKWALLDGTRALPRVLSLPSTSQNLPADACEGHALVRARRMSTTLQDVQQLIIATGKYRLEKDPKKPGQWVVLRSRQAATNFRRWAAAESARAACRLVIEAPA